MRTPAMGAGRSLLAPAVTVLTLLTLATTPPAGAAGAPVSRAAAVDSDATVRSSASGTQTVSGAACPVAGRTTERTRVPRSGAVSTDRVDDRVAVSHPDDATDSTSYRLRTVSSFRATSDGAQPRSVVFSGRFRADARSARGSGSGCDSSGSAGTGFTSFLRLTRPTVATLTLRSTGGVSGNYGLDGPGGSTAGVDAGLAGTRRTTVLLPAGPYVLSGEFDLGLTRPARAGALATATGSISLGVGFVTAGAATSATSGPGARLVSLPAGRSCRHRALTAVLRDGAGRLDRVVVTAGGRRAVVESPAAGRRVVLRGLPAAQPVTVSVVLDPRRGRTTTATRRYAPCTG